MYSYILNIHDYERSNSIELQHVDRLTNFHQLIESSIDPMIDEWFGLESPRYDWHHGEIMLLNNRNEVLSLTMYHLVNRLADYLVYRHGFTIHRPDVVASVSFDDTITVDGFMAMSEMAYRHPLDKKITEAVTARLSVLPKAPVVMTLDNYIEMVGEPANEYELTDLINKYEHYKESSREYDKNFESQ